MTTLDKILITQVVFLFVIHFMLHPDSPLSTVAEKIFGDYKTALTVISGGQIVLIVLHVLYRLWVFL